MRSFTELWPTLKRLLAYGSPWRRPLLIAVGMMWIAAAAEVSGPLLISYFIDNMVAKNSLPLKLVSGLAVAYLGLQILAATLHYNQSLLFNRAAVGVVQQLRSDVMDAALRQPLSEFDTQPVGQLISRVTNDTEVIRDLYVTVVATVLRSAALIGAMLVAMFSLDWRMALVALAIFPAVLIVMMIYQRYSTPIVRRVRAWLADINDGFNEVINGMGVIQQFPPAGAVRRADARGQLCPLSGAHANAASRRLPAASAAQPLLDAGAVRAADALWLQRLGNH
ncbi:Multidrug resistance-like ATP-binding protein MdlB [Raoultella terrigena]|nr:Multidrug resistance-like ATP-binding protein MdlB [Raoultella terrigena]